LPSKRNSLASSFNGKIKKREFPTISKIEERRDLSYNPSGLGEMVN
jgi:hypothetical protein